MSSRPFRYSDSNFSVGDLDVVGLELDREIELVLARADVVLPAVPGTGEDATLEAALAQWPLEVEAVRLDGVEAAVAIGERDLLLARLHGPDGARRDVLHPCDGHELHGRDPSNRTYKRGTLPAVSTILLCGVDLFFRGKLEALLPGHHFVTADSADWPDLVIADISRVDPDDVADSYPDVPIVGFGGHTDTAGLRRAHEAGFDQVIVKNALQDRAPQIVEELIASVE